MDIATIKQMDVGIKNIICTGITGYISEPKHITGVKNDKPYDFWSQFITLKDETDEIGVSLSDKNKNTLLTRADKGRQITVHKCSLESYKNDKQEIVLKLTGYLQVAESPQHQQERQAPQNVSAPARDYDKENKGKCCFGFIQATIQAGVHPSALAADIPTLQDIEKLADICMNGLGGLPNPEWIGENPPPLPDDDDLRF